MNIVYSLVLKIQHQAGEAKPAALEKRLNAILRRFSITKAGGEKAIARLTTRLAPFSKSATGY